MNDADLDEIRKQRLAQLQSQYGGGGGGGGENVNNAKAQEEQRIAMEDARNSILAQVLSQDARARLNTIKLSRPEKGSMIEGMILRMAQSGQVRGRIGEQELIGLLESVNQQMPRLTSSVKFDRRRVNIDSDDEI